MKLRRRSASRYREKHERRHFKQLRDYGGNTLPDRDSRAVSDPPGLPEGGDSLDEFLKDFPSVDRQLAVSALQQAGDLALAHARVA
jgi:hypothetical protein